MTTRIEFAKVDVLRRHMLLTTSGMAKLFKTTRQTYHSWVKGLSYPTPNKEARVRVTIKKLLTIVNENNWPDGDVILASSKERLEMLLALTKNDT